MTTHPLYSPSEVLSLCLDHLLPTVREYTRQEIEDALYKTHVYSSNPVLVSRSGDRAAGVQINITVSFSHVQLVETEPHNFELVTPRPTNLEVFTEQQLIQSLKEKAALVDPNAPEEPVPSLLWVHQITPGVAKSLVRVLNL